MIFFQNLYEILSVFIKKFYFNDEIPEEPEVQQQTPVVESVQSPTPVVESVQSPTPVVESVQQPLLQTFFITPDNEEEILRNKRFLKKMTGTKVVKSFLLQNGKITFKTNRVYMNNLKNVILRFLKPPDTPVKNYNTNNQVSIKDLTHYVLSKKNTKLYIILKDTKDKQFCIKISD